MLVLILPSCSYCRWFPYWFRHITGLVIDACNGCLAYCSRRWCSCWFWRLVARIHESYADPITALLLPLMLVLILPLRTYCRWFPYWFHHSIGVVVDARGSSLASLFSPLMPVLISLSCHHYSCRLCSCWFCRLVTRFDDSHVGSITLLALSLMLVVALYRHCSRRWCPYWFPRLFTIVASLIALDARGGSVHHS